MSCVKGKLPELLGGDGVDKASYVACEQTHHLSEPKPPFLTPERAPCNRSDTNLVPLLTFSLS